jgi:hypothetical protein
MAHPSGWDSSRSPELVIELHLRGRVAQGRRDDLVAFLVEAIPVYEEPGGIRVRMQWNTETPNDVRDHPALTEAAVRPTDNGADWAYGDRLQVG